MTILTMKRIMMILTMTMSLHQTKMKKKKKKMKVTRKITPKRIQNEAFIKTVMIFIGIADVFQDLEALLTRERIMITVRIKLLISSNVRLSHFLLLRRRRETCIKWMIVNSRNRYRKRKNFSKLKSVTLMRGGDF